MKRNQRRVMMLRLGTRSSNLAQTQSRMIARMLQRAHPGLKIEWIEISTTGDQVRDKPLKSFGGAGVFVKELENALLEDRIDLAVHSLKDVPTRQPGGLCMGAIVGREDTRDAVILHKEKKLGDLPAGSVIGSGSMRRRAQLKRRYPHLEFAEIRGNVETRIRKVRDGEYAGTILARAGLKRLGLLNEIAQVLPLSMVLPAPGQGALGLECRARDTQTRALLSSIHDSKVEACVFAERTVLAQLGGGCHLPVGALGEIKGRTLALRAMVGLPDGTRTVESESSARLGNSPVAAARALGRKVARDILRRGGREILAKLENSSL